MLTDRGIRAAQPGERVRKLWDGDGLFLVVPPSGNKLWRMRYQIDHRERLMSLGPFPEIGLAEARDKARAIRAALREGRDPAAEKRQLAAQARAVPAAAGPTLEEIAREWHALHRSRWRPVHVADVIDSLVRHVFPVLGPRDIASVTPGEVLACLRVIEALPAIETARRVRQRLSAIYDYAIAAGKCEHNPAERIKAALAPLPKSRPRSAILDPVQACAMLRDVESTPAHPVTQLALRFLALTAARPGEVRHAEWCEFVGLDGPEPVWVIPAARMKMDREHRVPLVWQAVELLHALRPLTGRGMPFGSARHARKPLCANAMGYLLNRAGYHGRHVPHGWRATFSTVMNDLHPADRGLIDAMLSHAPDNPIEAVYNRAEYRAPRRRLAQAWADLLLQPHRPAALLLEGDRR